MQGLLICEATKTKGGKCTNKSKKFSAISNRNLCMIHFNQEERKFLDSKGSTPAARSAAGVEESESTEAALSPPTPARSAGVGGDAAVAEAFLNFSFPPALSAGGKRKLIIHLQKKPKQSDGPGNIYIYSLAAEQGMDYWKIGMTKKDTDERLKEWETQHGVRILKRAEFHVKHGRAHIERMIHLALVYCRMIRKSAAAAPSEAAAPRRPLMEDVSPKTSDRAQRGRMFSVWYETGKPVYDRHYDQLMEEYESVEDLQKAIVRNKSHKEWFCAPIEEVLKIVNACISLPMK